MLHDCAKNASDVFAAADALEAFLAAGVAHCFAVYVEKRTVYVAFLLYGSPGADCGADHCSLQSGLCAADSSGISAAIPGWHGAHVAFDEHGAAFSPAQLYVGLRRLVLPLL